MSYVLAFLGFVALIVLHEGGHFVAAKAVGMRVERFSLFFGPMPLKWRRGETEYGVGVLPLGGYVRITGMNPHEDSQLVTKLEDARTALASTDDEAERHQRETEIASLEEELRAIRTRGYYNQTVWKRIVVILAGPAVNLLIAFLIVAGIFLAQGKYVPDTSIARGSLEKPATTYLKAGDRIVAVDGRHNLSFAQITAQIGSHRCAGAPSAGCHAKTPVRLTVARNHRLLTFSIAPRYDSTYHRMRIGFGFGARHVDQNIAQSTSDGTSTLWHWTTATASTVARVFVPKEQKKLHSFVGAFKIEQQAVGLSATAALLTIAVISLSLAVINLFPFLPLDGGHVFWALAEKIRGRRIPFSVMERAGFVGFALILFVFVIGLSNDISTLTGSGFNLR